VVIQRILFPQINKCTEQALYFRASDGAGAVSWKPCGFYGSGSGWAAESGMPGSGWAVESGGMPGSGWTGGCGCAPDSGWYGNGGLPYSGWAGACDGPGGSGSRRGAGKRAARAWKRRRGCGSGLRPGRQGRSFGKVSYCYSEGILRLSEGEPVGFDTYFNGFSIDKWKKYTVLDNLFLRITLSGRVKVTLVGRTKVHETILEKILSETIIDTRSKQTFDFAYDIQHAKGMLAFELEALDGEGILYGGAYCSRVLPEKLRNVTIGAAVCTFRREEFVEKNLRILREEILENPESVLYGRLEVFVSDNGKTLDAAACKNSHVHLYPNRNLGGAGGFTRCLIEMKRRGHPGITHALLMDDDIVIEPQALERTYMLLALCREAYLDAFIGGAMLRLDQQSIQFEAGAVWHPDTGMMSPLKSGLDLRSCESCLYNEIEESANYHAWWYCCFPLETAADGNLPLPLFIKMDDVEYGLRNMQHLILLNGICVWHEPFEYKYSSSLEYYNIRNRLISCAMHSKQYGVHSIIRQMLAFCLREITYYRYKNVDLYLRGICDFLKGPGWLSRQDGEQLHKELMQAGYQAQELEGLDMEFQYSVYEASRYDYGQDSSRKKRILTLNGLLLPAKGDNIAPMASVRGVHFYRRKRVMNYEDTSSRAFITERSVIQMVRAFGKVIKVCMLVSRNFRQAQRAYQEEGKRLTTVKFWKRYLQIK